MTHPRKIIRTAVVDAIKAADTAAGDRVWAGMEAPVDVETTLIEEGPVVLVYARRDRSDERDYSVTGGDYVRRHLDLIVEATAVGNLTVDDKLDGLAEAIEEILDALQIPGMANAEIRHVETLIDAQEESKATVGGALLMFDVCYFKAWRAPVADDDFPCPINVGVTVNGGPREAWPMGECHNCD